MSIWQASLTDLELGFKPKISGSRRAGPASLDHFIAAALTSC